MRTLLTLLLVLLHLQAFAGDKPYKYTTDWFQRNTPVWERILKQYRGKPNVRYLEIGVYEGRSFFWVLDNILTHPSARATALDLFDGDLEERFSANLDVSGARNRVTVIKGYSQDKLRTLLPNSFDVIYVDASHTARDVYVDVALSWGLLKERGVMIFDDYMWYPYLPVDLTPKLALDAFLKAFGSDVQILYKGFQLAVRKTSKPCPHYSCSTFAHYGYSWAKKQLYDLRTNKLVPLSADDRITLERFLSVFSELRHEPALEHALDQFAEMLSRISVSIKELR